MSPPMLPMIVKLKNYSIAESGCWLWEGLKDKDGYGVISNGRNVRVKAHRASYTFHVDKIPSGYFVCHKCDVTSCINPDHLFCGTPKDNSFDMVSKNRSPVQFGELGHNVKLNNLKVLEIRELRKNGLSLKAIADMFDITFQHVSTIINRKAWVHI